MLQFCNYLRGQEELVQQSHASNVSLSEKLSKFRQFFKHLGLILKCLFPSFLSASTLLIVLLLIDVIALEFMVYQVGLLGGKFYETLTDNNLNAFLKLAAVSICLIVLNSLMVSLRDFCTQLLAIVWRKYLTLNLHDLYFSNKNFYYIQRAPNLIISSSPTANRQNSVKPLNIINEFEPNEHLNHSTSPILIDNSINSISNNVNDPLLNLDNPDQRITQDVNTLCQSFSTILPLILISPFVIAWYTYQTFINVGYTGPLVVFGYFMIWALINGPLTRPIIKMIYALDRKEGDFRFKHMNLRANSESIAFYDSSLNELRNLNQQFDQLLNVAYRKNWKELILKFFVNTSQFMGGIIAYLVLGIPIFSHVYSNLTPAELGKFISNYSFKCQYLIYLFTRLYGTFDQVTNIAGNSRRVGELITRMNENRQQQDGIDKLSSNKIILADNLSDKVCFEMENVCVFLPDRHKVLIRDLNFKFESGTNVLVTGRSGCGKTSLLRCINGLWNSFTGRIVFNQNKRNFLFFLPQTSYFTCGSLLEQIIYPTIESEYLNQGEEYKNYLKQRIDDWFKRFNLEHLLNKVKFDLSAKPDFNWTSILSAGEQQKLSFLRVLFHNPEFVLLDEFTSSVDQTTEALMYDSLIENSITVLSIAHRDTVRKYHQIELIINADTTCQIKHLNQ